MALTALQIVLGLSLLCLAYTCHLLRRACWKYHALLHTAAVREAALHRHIAALNLNRFFESDTLQTSQETWKSYALALEVLCETTAEMDPIGSQHAAHEVSRNRALLQALGEYDA